MRVTCRVGDALNAPVVRAIPVKIGPYSGLYTSIVGARVLSLIWLNYEPLMLLALKTSVDVETKR